MLYSVDRRFVAATSTSLQVTGGPTDEDWVQVFRGIFQGMNINSTDVKTCVKDATNVPLHLEASFRAFEDRAIFKGLHLFGVAIGDVVAGMEDCGVEQALTGRIKTFVTDLVACASEGRFSFG